MHNPPDILTLAYKQPLMQEQMVFAPGKRTADTRVLFNIPSKI